MSAANIAALINHARRKGKWDFFSRGKQLILITCLEDSTNEVLHRCIMQLKLKILVNAGIFG